MAFTAGVAAGAAAVIVLLHPVPATDSAGIRVRQVSGDTITHSGLDVSGKSIKFHTMADGKGEAVTEIPKSRIPEAYSWINMVHSVNLLVGYTFGPHGAEPYAGLLYTRRFGRITLGGGVDLSYDFVGIHAAAGLCW